MAVAAVVVADQITGANLLPAWAVDPPPRKVTESTQRLKILLIDRRGKPGIAKVDHRPPQGYILIFAKRKQQEEKWAAFCAEADNPDAVALRFLSTKGHMTFGHPYRYAKELNPRPFFPSPASSS